MKNKLVILSFLALSVFVFANKSIAQEAEKPAEKTEEVAKEQTDKKEDKVEEKVEDKAAETSENKTEEKAEDADKKTDEKEKSNEKNEEKKEEKKVENTSGGKLEDTLIMELKDGKVVIELRPDLAPNHVARIKELVREGFYDGIVFHRVIEGFMAQTGDPTGTGRGGSGQNLKAEFSAEKHVAGTLSMARANDPDSADSQFFIVFGDAPHLDNNYTVFGKVISGMEFVNKIKKGYGPNGMVSDPDKIISLKDAADVEYTDLPDSLKSGSTGGDDAKPVATEAPKDPSVIEEKTETTTNPDGSIDVIKKTLKKEPMKEEDKEKGVQELAPKKTNPESEVPASLQKTE